MAHQWSLPRNLRILPPQATADVQADPRANALPVAGQWTNDRSPGRLQMDPDRKTFSGQGFAPSTPWLMQNLEKLW